jgi:S-formylglutathione hydrolase FrmB
VEKVFGQVDRHWMPSTSLEGNPLGDPASRALYVWSPPGIGPEISLPTVLLLPAFTSTGVTYLSEGWRRQSLPQRLDAFYEEGMAPVRLVLPDCMTAVGGSQYLNSAGCGEYATWIAQEVPAFVEARYAGTGRWGAVGSSSGGYGALVLAMTRPGRFHAIAAHSPDSAFEVCYPPDFPAAVEVLRAAGGLGTWWADFSTRNHLKSSDHAVLGVVGMSCAYSPKMEEKPLPCRLPVDLETGAVDSEVFERWLAFDPLRMIPEHAEALSKLAGLWLDVGRKDEFRLQVGSRLMDKSLSKTGIQCTFSEHDGGHFGLKSRLDYSLPWLARILND